MNATLLSPIQLKRIHMALSQASGDVPQAASLLGIARDSLEHYIREIPELSSYSKGGEPSRVELIARPPVAPPDQPPDPADLSLAEASRKADEQVRKGFSAIGVTGDALTEAMAFRDFGRFHFRDLRHFAGGGMAKLFADTMAAIKDVTADLKGVVGDTEREKVLREDRSRLIGHVTGIYDRVREAAVSEAVISAKQADASAEKRGRGKPGAPAFPPLAMQVTGNVSIQAAPQPKEAPPTEGAFPAEPVPPHEPAQPASSV